MVRAEESGHRTHKIGKLRIPNYKLRIFLWLVTAIAFLSLTGCQVGWNSTQYSVQRVSDGDTLTVVDAKGTVLHVRFACVDAPEIPHSTKQRASKKAADRDQFQWGIKAQQRLQQLIRQGGDRVNVKITSSDRYGRKVGEVRLGNGTLLQEVLAQEGLVLVYPAYLKNCPSATVVEQAAAQAQQQKRGVWSDARFVAPWKYRSARKL